MQNRGAAWPHLIYIWLYSFWRLRYAILVFLIALPVIGFLVGSLRPKVYESRMSILIQESAKHNPFLEDFAVETRIKDRIAALKALAHSRHILLGVAYDLKWVNEESAPEQTEAVLRKLSDSLHVRLIGEELVELSYRAEEREGMDTVLLAIANRFIENVLAPGRSSISGSMRFLEMQLAESAAALATAEAELGQFRSENADALPNLHAGNVARLSAMKALLAETRTELDSAIARRAALFSRFSQFSPVIRKLEQRIVTLTSDIVALRNRYTDNHSAVIKARSELARLTKERDSRLVDTLPSGLADIEAALTAALDNAAPESGTQLLLISQLERLQEAESRVIDLERKAASIQREVDSLSNIVIAFGETGKILEQLTRTARIKRDSHERLMERAEMARVTGALGQFEAPERVKVIDKPVIPLNPTGFPPSIYAVMGLVAGLAAAAGLVVVHELLNQTIRTRKDVERLLDIPVLTRIPAVSRQQWLNTAREDMRLLLQSDMPFSMEAKQ